MSNTKHQIKLGDVNRDQAVEKIGSIKDYQGEDIEKEAQKAETELVKTYESLPIRKLTLDDLENSEQSYSKGDSSQVKFTGFLYYEKTKKFVGAENPTDAKWILANCTTTNSENILLWDIWSGSDKEFYMTTNTDESSPYYFNYRVSTGAAKVYSSYDTLKWEWSDNNEYFNIICHASDEKFGTTSTGTSSNDEQLYNHGKLEGDRFQFIIFDKQRFNEDDKKIFKLYVEEKIVHPHKDNLYRDLSKDIEGIVDVVEKMGTVIEDVGVL